MSYFLRNLIDRHHEGSASPELSHKVQPRPKARFETDTKSDFFVSNAFEDRNEFSSLNQLDSDTGLDTNRNDTSSESFYDDDLQQTFRQAPVPKQHHNEKRPSSFHYSPRIDNLHERIENVTFKLGRNFSNQETPYSTSHSQNIERFEFAQKFFEIPTKSNDHQQSLTDDINGRIQSILQHLNSLQPQPVDEHRTNKSQHNPALSDIDNKTTIEKSQSPLLTEPSVDLVQAVDKLKIQSIKGQSEYKEAHRSGVLQIPSWLTEMQDDLNDRWQAMNAGVKAEPVVNVTIGRVEVKAVQPDSAKQPKARNKPSGVMSLDDYLKQRENRGK